MAKSSQIPSVAPVGVTPNSGCSLKAQSRASKLILTKN